MAKFLRVCPAAQPLTNRSVLSVPTMLMMAACFGRFSTIAQAGEPGGDSWGGVDDLFRARHRYLDNTQF